MTDEFDDLLEADLRHFSGIAGQIAAEDRVRHEPPAIVWEAISVDATAPGAVVDITRARRRRRSPGRRNGLRLAAAAAAVIAVVVGTSLFTRQDPTLVATATNRDLPEQFDGELTATTRNQVDQVGLALDFSASLPTAEPIEIWLLRPDLSDMVSLGVIDDTVGWVPVPDDIDLSEFSVVDVSLEPDDGDPTHSGRSILRGSLVSI
ncbi:MAG: anti-sigma factor [Acidimicrobiales bacterium]